MGNILVKIKRFFQNKNTVTIICVLAGILVLYIGYNWRVNSATQPVSIPYAKNTLESQHVITRDDIGYVEVASSVVEKMPNLIRNANLLIGKEVTYGNTVQMNGFFCQSDVADSATNQENSSKLLGMEDGYSPITIDVDLHSTYGNAMYPGNYIDLWFRGTDESGRLMYGKFIQSIKILDVDDAEGHSVFESTAVSRTPSQLVFAVPDDLRALINNAQEIGELVPVPRNKSYTANPGETVVASTYLQNYILSQTAIITDNNTNTSGNNNTTVNEEE